MPIDPDKSEFHFKYFPAVDSDTELSAIEIAANVMKTLSAIFNIPLVQEPNSPALFDDASESDEQKEEE